MNELHVQNPGHNLTSSEVLSEQATEQEGAHSGTEETRARQVRIPADPVNYTKEVPVREGKWKEILACKHFKGNSLSTAIAKLVMRLAIMIKMSEKLTEQFIGKR